MPILNDPNGTLRPPKFTGERRSGKVRIAKGIHCEWVLNDQGINVQWYLEIPLRVSGAMLRRYKEARSRFNAQVADDLGLEILVIDL